MSEVQVSFYMSPHVFFSCHCLATSETTKPGTTPIHCLSHHRIQAGIEVWRGVNY